MTEKEEKEKEEKGKEEKEKEGKEKEKDEKEYIRQWHLWDSSKAQAYLKAGIESTRRW